MIETDRRETLNLRARVVVLERMVMAALELALRIRPETLQTDLELARARLASNYDELDFAEDISDPDERDFLAREVERLMRGVQSDLGFKGGLQSPENG